MFRKIFLIFCMAVSWLVIAGNAGAASVELFSPEGTVRDIRQVTVRFSDQMVAFGDPRPADPFDIQCPAKGNGRWIDGRNWSYDFERTLPAGIACTFTLKANHQGPLSGVALQRQKDLFLQYRRASRPHIGSL